MREDRRAKVVDERLRVHAWTPRGFLSAGLLKLDEDGQHIAATFEYDPAYLGAPGAFPIDPVNLPLGRTTWATQSQFVSLGGIFDAAPDAWGRRVVAAQLPEQARQRVFRGAFLRGADGIGALVITPESLTSEMDMDRIVALSLAERPALSQIERAAKAAADLESGLELTEEMRSMLGGSWTIGGARPKSILGDDRAGAHTGQSVIAKFDSVHDVVPRNRIEAACLRMAQDMGFRVPALELHELSGGRTALVLERFDRTVIAGEIHRRHYLSAMSLASYEPQSRMQDSRQDQARISWSKLLELASRVCVHPSAARVEMFGRLVLNTALQNTDDHLKNFGFLRSINSSTQYEVAPVFDVSAQAATRHYLHCLDLGQAYSLQDVLPHARRLGVSIGAAKEVEERVIGVLHQAGKYLDEAGLNRAQAEKVLAWIDGGCGPHYRPGRHVNPDHDSQETEMAVPSPAPG